MVLAIILMIAWLFLMRSQAANYVCYVLLFNMLVAPVFSAGLVTSERERQTLDLLLTTPLTPYQIYWGKMLASLRISSVLSLFLLWPMGCAFVLLFFQEYYRATLTFGFYLVILGLAFLTTSNVGLFCSTLAKRTVRSLLSAYAIVLALFCAPLVLYVLGRYMELGDWLKWVTIPSPFAAVLNVPLYLESDRMGTMENLWRPDTSVPNLFGYPLRDLAHFGYYCLFTVAVNLLLTAASLIQFASRWRVSSSQTH
jgi:ABC-type transport system involved in multi-copper enzyme maturation permease subunit